MFSRKNLSSRIVLILLSLLVITVTLQAAEKGLTPEMVVDLKRVTQVALDPSGKNVAFLLTVPWDHEDKPGRGYSEIWLVPFDGGMPRPYTSKPASSRSVSWSPDGNWITFLSKRKDRDEYTQIYKMRVDGGEAMALTHHGNSIRGYHWSPDGSKIAFVSADPETKEEKATKKAGKDWQVYDENYKHRRLWILDVASGETRQLTRQNLSVWHFIWTPDSKGLIAQATETPLIDDSYVFQKMYKIAVDDGNPEVLCETAGKLGAMTVSPDGKTLAFLGAVSLNDPLAQSLFTVPLSGGTPKNLTESAEFSGTWIDWQDNKTLILLANKGTQTVLSKISATDGKMKNLVTDGPILQTIDFSRKTGRFVATAHSAEHPREVYSGKLTSSKVSRLTHHNGEFLSIRLARQEVIEWKGADDWTIAGILTYPLDYKEGQRYPLVLQIHGGPEGVSLNGWTTRAGYPVQVLAAQGYFVLQPNYRGSGGRGVAFGKADHDDLGGKEFDDVLAGVDALIDRGLVDGNRVGTGGWSYGGYFSAWAATRHSERFKASVVAAGLTNMISFAGTTDIPHEMSLVHWNSYWVNRRDLHWQRSPVFYIEKAKTPTLIVHGMVDERVHPEQSMELYTALKLKKIPTQLVLYPREPHGLREHAHQIDFMKRAVAWFNEYLKIAGTN